MMSSTNRKNKSNIYKDNATDPNLFEDNTDQDLKGAVVNKKYINNISNINLTFNGIKGSGIKDLTSSQMMKKKSKNLNKSQSKSKQPAKDKKSSKNNGQDSALDQSNFMDNNDANDFEKTKCIGKVNDIENDDPNNANCQNDSQINVSIPGTTYPAQDQGDNAINLTGSSKIKVRGFNGLKRTDTSKIFNEKNNNKKQSHPNISSDRSYTFESAIFKTNDNRAGTEDIVNDLPTTARDLVSRNNDNKDIKKSEVSFQDQIIKMDNKTSSNIKSHKSPKELTNRDFIISEKNSKVEKHTSPSESSSHDSYYAKEGKPRQEKLNQNLLQKLGFDLELSESQPEDVQEGHIRELSERIQFGYKLSTKIDDITEKKRRGIPRFRRHSTTIYDQDVFKEYLLELQNKRAYFIGSVQKASFVDPGWQAYLDLYKQAHEELKKQVFFINQNSRDNSPEETKTNIINNFKRTDTTEETKQDNKTWDLDNKEKDNTASKKFMRANTKNMSPLQVKHMQANEITQDNKAEQQKDMKRDEDKLLRQEALKLKVHADREMNFCAKVFILYKQFTPKNKIDYDEFVNEVKNQFTIYFKGKYNGTYLHEYYESFDDWIKEKIDNCETYQLAEYEKNLVEMELMGNFITNLINSLNTNRVTYNYLLARKESDVFKNTMSGFYQSYCYVQKWLDRYLIESDLKIEQYIDRLDKTKATEKFINSKIYLKSIGDYKIEAIHNVVFAQKVCLSYYKDYFRGNINFFGVLKMIDKYHAEKIDFFLHRREFYVKNKKLEKEKNSKGFKLKALCDQLVHLKKARGLITNYVETHIYPEEDMVQAYKQIYYSIKEKLRFVMKMDSANELHMKIRDIVITEISFGEEFLNKIKDFQDNMINSKTLVRLTKESIEEINFWSDFNNLDNELTNLDSISTPQGILDSFINTLGDHDNKANFVVNRYLRIQLNNQKKVVKANIQKQNDPTNIAQPNAPQTIKDPEVEKYKLNQYKRQTTLMDCLKKSDLPTQNDYPSDSSYVTMTSNLKKNADKKKTGKAWDLTLDNNTKKILVESKIVEVEAENHKSGEQY